MPSKEDVIAQLIAFWGFSCPKSGSFYICPDMKHEFLGCCSVNPCTEERNGVCPDADLQVATFSSDKWENLQAQSCDVVIQEAAWYTCTGTTPPFMGCCTWNSCQHGGCPDDKLRPAVLNKIAGEEWKRTYLLNPNGSGISYDNITKTEPSSSSSASSTSEPTSSSTNQPINDLDKSGGLSTGAIAGIAVGGVIAVLIIVAGIMWKCGWFPRKKKEEEIKQEADVPGAAMSHMSPMTPMAQQAYPHQGPHGYGYADESGRSVMSSPSTGYIRVSQHADSYVSGLTAPGSQYGVSPALSKGGLHSQHASPDLKQHGFDPKYGYNGYNDYQNNGLGLGTVAELPVTDQHFGAQELPAGNHPGYEMDAGAVQPPPAQNQQPQDPSAQEGDRQDTNGEQTTQRGEERRN
ncbi:hypothetical protein QBC32DRAFT_395269 [Pseudoneurospora amorphoporcata]|uniref:Uncharacterized protein n=1 Tax=Pseudoneurospora amorphoporcata TaxID=241081 RepID=A0AAN6P391_9PEZI|nr:hypothetical protein QBC32DRAFT_395269 [Pseudoneurospora amorphoporcata]